MDIHLPTYSEGLFKPYRYKILYGGRGSSKSWTMARVLLLLSKQNPLRILCAREFQNSIAESVHKLLVEQIYKMGMQEFFYITDKRIVGENGSEFIFKGLYTNLTSIKSMEGIDILWLEEAHTISKASWAILVPTIRKENSEIWGSFNPENDDDPTYTRFVRPDGEPLEQDNSFIVKVNWRDNPWFPEVLKAEKARDFEIDPDLAEHTWEGDCRRNKEAQILKGKWEVKVFEPASYFHGPYQGADWGFSQDPSTLIEMYIDPHKRELLIRREAWGLHVELDDLPKFYKDNIPEYRKTKIRADNSRPETINHLKVKHFINIEAAKKWKGSVEDGVTFLKSFKKIIIHPDCPKTAGEAKNYSYKVDKLTGDVLTKIVKKHDHCWDAIRYGLDKLITKKGNSILDTL